MILADGIPLSSFALENGQIHALPLAAGVISARNGGFLPDATPTLRRREDGYGLVGPEQLCRPGQQRPGTQSCRSSTRRWMDAT